MSSSEHGASSSGFLATWTRRPGDETWWAPLVVVHALAVWFLVGLIWTVHHVHYPLFALVGPTEYSEFQADHVDRIGAVLAVPWLVEGIATLGLLVVARRRRDVVAVLVGAAAAGGVLLISGLASAPAHAELADGFDVAAHDRLMTWNLVRASLWTLKGATAALLLCWLVADRRSATTAGPAADAAAAGGVR